MDKDLLSKSRGIEATTLFTFDEPDGEVFTAGSCLFLDEPNYIKTPQFKAGDLILNRYEVIGMLQGGMGQVYSCFDHKYSIKVAVKTILSVHMGSKAALASFFQEVNNCIALKKHQNIVKLYRAEMIDGYPYIISQWIEGHPIWGNSLKMMLERSYPFTVSAIVDFVLQICQGMSHCASLLSTSDSPFVHGDLKPANILVDDKLTFKLNDFGVRGMTAEYASPEQRSGLPLDGRSDIYSLGLMVRELLRTVEADQLSGNEMELLNCLFAIADKCISNNPDHRYSDFNSISQGASALCQDFTDISERDADCRLTITEQADRVYSQINMGLFHDKDLNSHIGNPRLTKMDIYDFKDYVTGSDMSFYKGEVARMNGDYTEAAEYYRRALTHNDGKAARAWDALGQIMHAQGRIAEAADQYSRAIDCELYFPAMYHEAELILLNADLTEQSVHRVHQRMAALGELLAQGRRGYHIFALLGRYHQIVSDYDQASCFYRECLQYPNGDDWLSIYRYGQSEYALRHVSMAAAIFKVSSLAITDDPHFRDNLLKLTTLINCCYYMWDDSRVMELLDVAGSKYELSPGYEAMRQNMIRDSEIVRLYMDKLTCLYQSGLVGLELASDISELLDELTEPGMDHSYRLLADMSLVLVSREMAALCDAGRYDVGLRACDKALYYDRLNPDMLLNKGSCHAALNELKEALQCFNLAATYETDDGKRKRNILIRDQLFARFSSSTQHRTASGQAD